VERAAESGRVLSVDLSVDRGVRATAVRVDRNALVSTLTHRVA
jgi:hypothetical protein